MASGFFAILDDIGALMDDVAVTTKVAAGKTAAILGDDLAVNAEKATGFLSSRELPVLWSITKGSLLNKLIIVPIALLLTTFVPVALTVLLMSGGCYLAYEGVEKIIEFLFHHSETKHSETAVAVTDQAAAEKSKVKAAVATDFILSIEIVIIALGSVSGQSLTIQIIAVSVVSVLATIGVYGIVALIVRMDDAGYLLIKRSSPKSFLAWLGQTLVKSLPVIIKVLGVIGTLALILVSGGIFVHHIHYLEHLFAALPQLIAEVAVGLAVGLIAVGVVSTVKYIRSKAGKR